MNEKVGGGHVKFRTICFICEPTENKWLSFSRNIKHLEYPDL